MIKTKTVLVLGAGASYPYGFPLARELINDLCKHPTVFRRNNPGYVEHGEEVLLHCSFQKKELENFRKDLMGSAFDSIDSFLTARPEYAEIGKAAIAVTLILKENPDALKGVEGHGGHWYRHLRNQMGESSEEFETSAKNLSIVSFNYDRSFEYFFFNALTSSYGQPRALAVLTSMKIIHVYGQLGKPDFLSSSGRGYATNLTDTDVAKCVSDIKVIPENKDGSEEFKQAAELIQSVGRVCFLGFGYNPTNLKRIAVGNQLAGACVWGTMFGMKSDERTKAFEILLDRLVTEEKEHNFGKENEDALLFLTSYPVLR